MSEREYIRMDGTIVKESELTPEIREELGLDENGNEIDDDDDELWDPYYESEMDVARGEGFYIDDDGEWRPMDDEDDW